jgi:hypothetical protein
MASVLKAKTIINCDCISKKSHGKHFTENNGCVCYIGTSMNKRRKINAKKVQVTV